MNNKIYIGLILLLVLGGIAGYFYMFPQNFEPHQEPTDVSTPYFEYKYVRNATPNRCIIDAEPSENGTISFVKFTVTSHDGTILDEVSGVQNENNTLQWYTDWFTVNLTSVENTNNPGLNENGWINCSAQVKDSHYELYEEEVLVDVGYSLQSSCDTTDSCVLSAGKTNARGYYYYDYIELPVGQTLTTIIGTGYYKGYAYFYANEATFIGSISKNAATGAGSFVVFDALNITTTNITLNGEAGSGCDSDGAIGGIVFYNNFVEAYVDGAIVLNGGAGGDCTSGGGDGGDGGDSGKIYFEGLPGTIYLNTDIDIRAGDGGDGDDEAASDGGYGGYGGDASPALNFENCEILFQSGVIDLYGGDGGDGGTGGNTASEHGGRGEDGGDCSLYFSECSLDENPSGSDGIDCRAGDGGNGGGGLILSDGGNGGDGGGVDLDGVMDGYFFIDDFIQLWGGDGGDGGASPDDGGDGGDGSCIDTSDCEISIKLSSLVLISSTVETILGSGGNGGIGGDTDGDDGSDPACGNAWELSYNSSLVLAGNDFNNLECDGNPDFTLITNSLASYPIPYDTNLTFSAGMIRYANMTATVDIDENSTGMVLWIKHNNYSEIYTSSQELDMHGYENGTYSVMAYGHNAHGYLAPIETASDNVSYIPTNLICNTTPASLLDLYTKIFTVNCWVNNTVDNTSIYLSNLITNISDNYRTVPWDEDESIYTEVNEYYYSYGTEHTFFVDFTKTDYAPQTTQMSNVSVKAVLIEIPTSVDDVLSICLFPYHHDVKPVGQTPTKGIFRIVNMDNESNITVWVKTNQTLPTNVTQGLANDSSKDWSEMVILNTTYQEASANISAYDGTQNVSAYSVYAWLWTNCTNASGFVNGSVTHYRNYDWYTYTGGNTSYTTYTDSPSVNNPTAGRIVSSFGNSSRWIVVGFTEDNNTVADYYRVENGTISLNLSWSGSGIATITYNFTEG